MSRAYEAIKVGLNSFDPDEKRLSVEASVKFGDREEIVNKLIELLNDGDKGVRDAVANAIVSIANEFETSRKKIISQICKLILCKDVGFRNFLVEIILRIGKDAIPDIKQLANHEDKDVRKIAIDIIGFMGDEDSVDFLIEKLSDPDPNVITSAIEAIGNIGDDRAIEVLLDSFSKFEFAQIQIIEALGKIGERSKNKKLICDFLIEIFRKSEEPILKSAIVEALGKAGDESYADFLMGLVHDKNIAIQKMAVISLVEACARANCKFNANKYFFKSFFKRAAEIFFETNDLGFKTNFLNFISKWIEFNEVKGLIIALADQNEPIFEKVVEIIRANAKELIQFALENEVKPENFISLVESAFLNANKIFEDVEFKKVVADKLSELFEIVDMDMKVVILNLLSSLNAIEYDKNFQKVQDDPVFKLYFGIE